MKLLKPFLIFAIGIIAISCNNDDPESYTSITQSYPAVEAEFGSSVDLNNLANYANQNIPSYITKDNSGLNPITDKGATLGRVLFYDKKLSVDNSVSCASCHKQAFAFSDTNVASTGVNGTTGRHSMRLINTRFATETKFFWDERASSLEMQTTMPIKDHAEMGFSGANGDLSFNDLIVKLSAVDYYKELFKFVYGTEEITESKIQFALAQFIRSIQSFDSKYDTGRASAPNDGAPFSNFTAQENQGKNLFLMPPTFNASSVRTGGGLGCAGCHRAPEFDIDPNTLSNGIGGSINGGADFTNTRAPSLRNLIQTNDVLNGPMMHTGVITSLQASIGHYGNLTNQAINNPNLDPRLKPNGIGQQLNLTATEVNAVIAFLKTLSGTDVYTNPKWSDPFN
ncbi:cytochrome-c peroxidase [Flavobacterium urocaniciphilum]|uniref:Cytochrome c peroxidase n=1 Tax=Flavobacterium urocaniciphilum TaxID=1299341 RepID=A0A1H8ZDW5_9FLAO|nr:cytochrome c peroxidase [Flavobacterium urocaniciphilum]SEP62367.1 cytochrome c peroxidase [Flavobacterium urocaniciphilum]